MANRNLDRTISCALLVPWLAVAAACGATSGSRGEDTEGGAVETKFTNPDGNSKISSYLIEKIDGAPVDYSNASTLNIVVTRRNGESQIKYKAANSDKLECVRNRNWSALSRADTLSIDTSALVDGDAVLCLVAYTPEGKVDSNPIMVQWLHDVTPPTAPTAARMVIPVPPATILTTSRTVKLRWVPSEDPAPSNGAAQSLMKTQKVLIGTSEGARDIYTQNYSVTDFEATITLPKDGDFYFSVASVDHAGNEGIAKISGKISVDGTPPPAPTSISWNPAGPTRNTTELVASWNAVQEDTAVTYKYKLETYDSCTDTSLIGSIQGTSAANTTQTTLSLGEGCHFLSVMAVNSGGLESAAWFKSPTPFIVDLTKPLISLESSPDGLVSHFNTIEIAMASSAQNQLDVHEYKYKVITGTDCGAKGTWSDWLPGSTQKTENIKGPAYEGTMSICAKARDAAGNESESDNVKGYRVASWTNKSSLGVSPDFSETYKMKIAFSANSIIKYLSSDSGLLPPSWSVTTPDPAPSVNGSSARTVTGANGTIYSGSDALSSGKWKTTITRTPSAGAPVSTDLSTIPGDAGPWCVGNLYLLDLATNQDPIDNFQALVSCITTTTTPPVQKIQVVSYDSSKVGLEWSRQEIFTRNTPVKSVGAISLAFNQFVAVTDPTDNNIVQTCVNPPTTGDCESALISIPGSEGTTALAALEPASGNVRVIISGEMSGTVRLGVASVVIGSPFNLDWIAVELATAENFILSPYLSVVP